MATTTTPSTGEGSSSPQRRSRVAPIRPRTTSGPLLVRFYRSAVGKKWVMAITGIILLGFILAHMIGNLKLYLSKEEINLYGEALRDMPGHLLPRTVLLWTIRVVLTLAFVFHIHSAIGLTRINRKARPAASQYQSKRDYVAADFASRTMRWTGIIVGNVARPADMINYQLPNMGILVHGNNKQTVFMQGLTVGLIFNR